ncbi:MAG: hypothetical protein ACP5XB_03295 [Isosphaeraceae bacterium]
MTVSLSLRSILARASATVLCAVAVLVLLGASDQLQDAMARLQSMSARQRTALAQALQRFDLKIPPDEQESIRQIDSRLNALPPDERVRYLAVLRRFHNWLDTLPNDVRDNLLAKAPQERMPQIKTLLARYPLPREGNPTWRQFTEFTGPSFFELASLFKLWQDMTPAERGEIEKLPIAKRRAGLLEHGLQKRSLHEFRPKDFRLEEWLPKVDAKINELREIDPELRTALTKAEKKTEDLAKEKPSAVVPARPPILHRLAVNLYTLSQNPHPVSVEKLDAFFSALPPWVQSSFDPYPADLARRRLTLVYRLVFPYPAEFRPPQHTQKPQRTTKAATGPGPGAVPVAPGVASPPVPRPPAAPPKPASRPSNSPF